MVKTIKERRKEHHEKIKEHFEKSKKQKDKSKELRENSKEEKWEKIIFFNFTVSLIFNFYLKKIPPGNWCRSALDEE